MTEYAEPAASRAQSGRMPASHVLEAIRGDYAKGGPSLFWLSLKMVALTIVTLGIYRFWMTTHLRRHYWGAIRLLGDPLEYTGRGLEKLLGFLVALVILAVYLGIVNLGLAFAGLFSLEDPVQLQIMLQLSLVAALPLIYFATYRARRYILARTRWRGIRLGMDQAAWGFTWRALLLTLLSVITLGLAYPYQHFRLQKYMIDRTWFGDLRFHQDGSWQGLFGYWVWFYLIVAIVGGAIAATGLNSDEATAITFGLAIGFFGYLAIFLVGIRYQVAAFRYLWKHRSLGKTKFRNDIDSGEVIGVYIGGGLATGILAALLSGGVLLVLGAIGYAVLGDGWQTLFTTAAQPSDDVLVDDVQRALRNQIAGYWLALVSGAAGYIMLIAFSLAFSQIFIIRPILRRKVEGMQIFNSAALQASQQRAHDHASEAGGFADALGVDVGAGF